MRHFLLTVLAAIAAAVVFTFTIPAEATTGDWELPPGTIEAPAATLTR
jgi:hypothetical protein